MLGMIWSTAVAGLLALTPGGADCRFPAAEPGDPAVMVSVEAVQDAGGVVGRKALRITIGGQTVMGSVSTLDSTPAQDWLVQRREADGRALVLVLNGDGRAVLVRQWPNADGSAPRTEQRAGACALDATDLVAWLPS